MTKPALLAAITMLTLVSCGPFAPERAPAARAEPGTLRFQIEEGRLLNAFLRQDEAAAHLVLRSGTSPRLIVAFPAGNSGVGLWWEATDTPVHWRLDTPLVAVHERDARGQVLHGVSAELLTNASRLVIRQAVLGSTRVLRDFELSGMQPEVVRTRPSQQDGHIRWARDRIDGAPGYSLEIHVMDGHVSTDGNGRLVLTAEHGQSLRLQVRAISGERALTSLPAEQLLVDASGDERSRQVLEFLSYREKFLAGSWRFNTYFGRDTLMSLRLLMPALQPPAVEAGLASVLARVSPDGEVAHEEDIGEFALLRRQREGGNTDDAPIFDYAMIDDDYMLAPVAAAWLLEDPRGRARANAFLAAKAADGRRNGDVLARNLLFVEAATREFAAEPTVAHLIALKPGRKAGNWRDSDEGLGRGRYPFDVNAVLAPAALHAGGALIGSGLLEPYLSPGERERLAGAAHRADLWERHAAPLFAVDIPAAQANARIRAYAAHLGVPADSALRALRDRSTNLRALALDKRGRPVPVMHSDEGFRLLFAQPSAHELSNAVAPLTRPFPAGLMTDAGMLVANPVFAGPQAWQRLDASAYHGTVVWSWHHALWAAGLERQLARDDLPEHTRDALAQARTHLWCAIESTRPLRTSELWSWSFRDGRYQVAPFGARRGDEDESNAAQLWSTVFLALQQPRVDPQGCPSVRNATQAAAAAAASAAGETIR